MSEREVDSLYAENERLRECLRDCIAFLRGGIVGPAQRVGIIREAEAALSAGQSGAHGTNQEKSEVDQ